MHFINTSDLAAPSWRFLADVATDRPDLSWETISGQPRNTIEMRIRRPALARWRAGAEAAQSARRHDGPRMLVSHLPLMSAATNVFRRLRAPDVPQIAFAFNFTELPHGLRRRFLDQALSGIEEFVVFSQFERPLYSAELGLDEARIKVLPWAMEPPVPGPRNPLPEDWPDLGYISAIGGEGRDYALLAQAMAERPDQRLAVVARPYSIAGIDFPPNVAVFTNLPGAETWRIAKDSRGLVIPLKTETTACGHITIVGAQLLGLPLVVSRSRGVADYVVDGTTAQVVPPGDVAALGHALDMLTADSAEIHAMAARAKARAEVENNLSNWVSYFAGLAERFA